MKVWGTKPPAKLSSANRPERRITIPRERCSGGSGSCSSSWPRSTDADKPAVASNPSPAANG